MTETITTNLSVYPYLDDFNEDKQYVKILFKPSKAAQTRELNQLQTILQNQISRFSSHVFKEGSIVSGIAITYNSEHKYVHLENRFNANTLLSVASLTSNNLIVSNTGLRAVATVIKNGFTSQYPNTNRLYLKYLTTGKNVSNNDVYEFTSGETLTVYKDTQSKLGALVANNILDTINVLTANATANATGTAYSIACSDGVIYQKGYFSKVQPQIVLVKEFDTNTANYSVGFNTTESVVTFLQDNSLVDNALGEPNESAPGADRLKLSPVLYSVDKTTLDANSSFFPIIEFNDTTAAQENVSGTYSTIGDELAKRTFEKSGDYVVKPFPVETLVSSNAYTMFYEASPGLGYVKGNRVELIGSKKIETTRAITTEEAQNQIVTANYGNYILVNEYVGNFDIDNISLVNIYDAPQLALSAVNGAGSVPLGNVIGTANVINSVYNSGKKGTSSCIYKLYLFNIKMNSGKTFSKDAKSFYVNGTYGKGKADIILEDSKAVIKDANKNSLIFDIGTQGVRRLTNKNGVNDTQFIFRDTISATLQANGFVTFTLNTPYAGGNERLTSSVGVLSDTNELNYDMNLTTEAYTANSAGTISVSGTTVTGSGTSFTTLFEPDEYIRIPSTGTVRRIVSIANNTSMTINATTSPGTVNYQKYYPEGQVIDLSASHGSITAISNTQFSVASNLILASGPQTVRMNLPLLRTSAVGIKKDIVKNAYVKIDCATNVDGINGPYDLGFVDILKVKNVYLGTTYSESNPDRTNWFGLDNGQTNMTYEHGKLVINPAFKSNINSSTKLLVKLDYFVANTAAGAGFFSVDSYPIRLANAVANTTNIEIGEIPLINGIDARSFVDFRPQRYNTSNSSLTIGGATINPALANTALTKVSTGSYIPDPDSNFQADIEYYLPRIDLLSITKSGDLVVTNGQPNINPKTPVSSADSMPIAEVYVPAYPSLTTREGEAYSRTDIKTKINLVFNRRYTEKDIGAIDQRIKRLEYYTALNLLEQQVKDLTIPDANGLDRFKNGFFAEPFISHNLGNVSDFEYKIAIDSDNHVARPFYKKYSIDYQLNANNSTNVQVSGSKVTLPYTPTLYISQPYATKYRNCTESVWKWNGSVSLYPSYDQFQDETALPAVNVNIDLATPFEQFANSPFGTQFGDWRTTGATSSTSVETVSNRSFNSTTTTNTTTRTTATAQSQSVSKLNVNVASENYNFGSFVKDVSLNPYMRSREVAFIIRGLKPNTRFYAFFDQKDVSASCAPGTLSGVSEVLSGQENRVVTRSAEYGSALLSDSSGNLYGVFKIPAESFRVGDREFSIANVSDLTTGASAILSSAKAIYSASNMSVTTQDINLTTRTPKISTSSSVNSRVIVDRDIIGVDRSVQTDRTNSDRWSSDPIAQSFLITSGNGATATFIDKIGVYFKTKDPTLGVTLSILAMSYDSPDASTVLASKYLPSASINISTDASLETVFDFDDVVPLTKDLYYAFQVKPDGDSPEYTIWMSEVGGTDVITGTQVFSNPYVGTAFISANSRTWTALQTEDIKFNIYRAKFTVGTGTALFNNEDDDYLIVDGFSKSNASIGIEVGDIVWTANSTGGLLTSNTNPMGYVQMADEANNELWIDKSRGGFTSNTAFQIHRQYKSGQSTYNANTLIASGNITSINNRDYSIIVPRFAQLTPAGTSVYYSHKGTDTSYLLDSEFSKVTPEYDNEKFDKMRRIVSKSNEIVQMGSAKSSTYQLDLTTSNDYVSPIIDMTRKSSFAIENIINNDSTNESTRYGNALTKYISKEVVLAEGQDAEDLLIQIGAYRPAGSSIEVYVKFLNKEDSVNINEKVWTKLDLSSGTSVYGSTTNIQFNEYEYKIPSTSPVTYAAYLNATNSNIVQYADANGVVYIGYKSFMIKVVLLSSDRARVPILKDLRATCLQV